MGFPGDANDKESACQCRGGKRHGFSPWVEKNPLEDSVATQSSVPAWRIPWREEPGGLQSKGLQRVRQLNQLSTHAKVLIVENHLKFIIFWLDIRKTNNPIKKWAEEKEKKICRRPKQTSL